MPTSRAFCDTDTVVDEQGQPADAMEVARMEPLVQREPFELPTDEEWTQLCVAEAAAAERRRQELHTLPVHLKSTLASRMHATVDPETGSPALKALLRGVTNEAGARPGAEAAPVADYARRQGDNIQDMLAKKRQIFLVQMSLDNKRSEISKLEQQAMQRNEALRASEVALEADAQRFDHFLKENDAKLQEALRKAEAEAKARQDRAAEAKRLAAGIAHTRSEISKAEEALGEARRCKAFLDRVAPREHFEAARAARVAAKEALLAEWRAACEAVTGRRAAAAAARERAEHDMQWARTQQQFERAEAAARAAAEELQEALAAPDPAPPDLSAADQEEDNTYFGEPAQLLTVFSQLEGRNMFMIQAAQDAEQTLEAARSDRQRHEAMLGADAAALARQATELEAAISAARHHCSHLRQQAAVNFAGSSNSGGSSSSQAGSASHGVPLPALIAGLEAAYEQSGFCRDASVTPLAMLAQIESRLEESVAAVEANVPAATAEQIEKGREKERRQAARQEKLAAQQAEHEKRIARVLERAAAPAFRRSTKVEMVRSTIQRRQKAPHTTKAADDAERELQAYLAREDSG